MLFGCKPGWIKNFSPSKHCYKFHADTGFSSWNRDLPDILGTWESAPGDISIPSCDRGVVLDLAESICSNQWAKLQNKYIGAYIVTSVKSSDELLRHKSRSRSVGGSPLESPRSSKVVNQGNGQQNSRVQRQRSFRRTEDEALKRSRSQSVAYELSQDLQEKQVEMLERKYGGSIRVRRAAKTIQRAFRQYSMSKNFEKLRHSVGERRLSKRLSELGRSNTVWSDRIVTDGHYIMGATVLQNNVNCDINNKAEFLGDKKQNSDTEKYVDRRIHHQMTLDPNHRIRISHRDKKRLQRSMQVDYSDIPVDQKEAQLKAEETNNNRNSCPEMNDSSASDSPQPTPVESAIDLQSLDFENLLESKEMKETDILTDSFHSDSVHSDISQDNSSMLGSGLIHKPSASSLTSDISTDTLDSCKSQSASFESFRTPCMESSDNASINSQNDIQIKVGCSSPDDQKSLEQKELAEQTVKFYMNTEVKLRNRKPGEDNGKKPPAVPARLQEASPIWKRKSLSNGGPAVKIEGKRMSNISETSEPDSIDGQCSSSPSSENVSAENISIGSESSVSYQRRIRLSVTPDQQHTVPKSADKYRKRVYRIGLNLFNKKPNRGLEFLCEHGFVEESPAMVAKFFITRKGMSKQMIGEYLGNIQNEFNMEVLHYFSEAIDLSGLQVDVALRKFQSYFRMPGEAQKIERLMMAFARRYCVCNPDQMKHFKNPDTVFLLAFAIIMLNTDSHNSNIKPERKMKAEDFIKNLRGIDDGEDVDRDMLMGIYDRIKAQEFRPGVDHVTQVMKVEQTIVGKKTLLALPHRRLVCYCRLYEVHDPNKKEKIGLHQREVFLFNDFILVTKIFSKKKSGITYSFKQSFSLCGMQVFLFETSHYQFGIRLTNNLDGKILITFNARNDHDRQKFVDDLKEAILETNGMEQLRIEEELHRHSANHNTIDRHYCNDDSRVLMYDLIKPSDPALNRLSAPECGGLKKIPLSNSLTDLCQAQGMRRGSSGGSLDSGMASGSTGSSNSREESFASQSSQSSLLKGPSGISGSKLVLMKGRGKNSGVSLREGLPEGTEV
ncbi:hypothetical protein ScPMuIL_008288 [Solemya velum]